MFRAHTQFKNHILYNTKEEGYIDFTYNGVTKSVRSVGIISKPTLSNVKMLVASTFGLARVQSTFLAIYVDGYRLESDSDVVNILLPAGRATVY